MWHLMPGIVWHLMPASVWNLIWHPPQATGLVVAGLLPSVLLYTYYITRIIDASVLITSVEYFRCVLYSLHVLHWLFEWCSVCGLSSAVLCTHRHHVPHTGTVYLAQHHVPCARSLSCAYTMPFALAHGHGLL